MNEGDYNEAWLERQATLMAKINDYGTTSRFGAFLFVVATGGLIKALFFKLLLLVCPRGLRIGMARARVARGRESFVAAITQEPRATMPVYMTVTSIYAFIAGTSEGVLSEAIDELYQVVRQARWRRASAGLDTCDLDQLIETYLEEGEDDFEW